LIAQFVRIAGPASTIREVYNKAINRLLRGEWREAEPSDTFEPYRDARAALEEWAWHAALSQNDPVSGVAAWKDELDVKLSSADTVMRRAVSNVCPIIHQDIDRLIEYRRFLHRTIRERFVAEHVAALSVDEAVTELEPHLWYDGNWQEVIPAAIAAHREARSLLRRLLTEGALDPACALATYRSRDGLDELRDMLVRLRQEASDSFWSGDAVLEPIFQSLPKQTTSPTLERDPAGDRERLVNGLRTGDLPYGDLGPRIEVARLLPKEQSELADAIARRLVSDRPMSAGGSLLYRHSLAVVLTALDPDETALAKTRTKLIERLPKDVAPEDVFDAILALRPTEAELKAIVPQALAALTGFDDAWSSVQMTASLIPLKLDAGQKRQIRAALLARIAEESTATWLAALVGSFGSTEPSASDIVGCVSLVTRSKTYKRFNSHDRKRADEALGELTSGCGDPDGLLSELIMRLRSQKVDSPQLELVAAVAKRASVQGQDLAAELVTKAVLEDEGWTFEGLKLVRVSRVSVELQRRIVNRLLEVLRRPDAFWGSIGEAIAWLDAAQEQRVEAAAHLLSTVASTTDLDTRLSAARVLNLLQPDPGQRDEALAILRESIGTVDASCFGELIGALGTFGADGRLSEADLLAIFEQLERLAGSFLGGWAGEVAKRGQLDSELRRRLTAKTLLPAERLRDLGFHSWNERVIDAAILSGSDQTLCAVLGQACDDALHTAFEAASTGTPLLDLSELECVLDHFSRNGIAGEEASIAARLSGALLTKLLPGDLTSSVDRLMERWRGLKPPLDLVQEVCRALLKPLPAEPSATKRAQRIRVASELEVAPEQAREIATALVDELVAGNVSVDPSMIARVSLSPEDLRRLIHSANATRTAVRAAAASVRRSVPLSLWKQVLPDLAAFGRAQQSP
jgi:hypothetical protein